MARDSTIETRMTPIVEPASRLDLNADALAREIGWFAQVANERLRDNFPGSVIESAGQSVPAAQSHSAATQPELSDDRSVYAEFVRYYKLDRDERLVLMLAVIPHVQPHLLDVFLTINKA